MCTLRVEIGGSTPQIPSWTWKQICLVNDKLKVGHRDKAKLQFYESS